jgi:ABC-type polysaccharide/polyol phosphate export permease
MQGGNPYHRSHKIPCPLPVRLDQLTSTASHASPTEPAADPTGNRKPLRSLASSLHAIRRMRAIQGHHQLLLELIRKDFDARYAGSFLGVLWTQLYPLLLLGVYSFVFSVIFKNAIPNFPLFLFVGIAIWSFFSNSVLLATGSVVANASLITKIGFPRELVTISVVLVAFLDLVMSHLILFLGALVFGIAPTWSWLALPFLLSLLVIFCVGLGLSLATAAVYLRDVRFFTEVGVLLLMFLTPVFYSREAVPQEFGWLLNINPLGTLISAYRGAFLDGIWPAPSTWATLVLVGVATVWIGIEVFDRGQRGFPDAL